MSEGVSVDEEIEKFICQCNVGFEECEVSVCFAVCAHYLWLHIPVSESLTHPTNNDFAEGLQ